LGDIAQVQMEINDLLEKEDVKWRQLAKEQWLKDGDKNTKKNKKPKTKKKGGKICWCGQTTPLGHGGGSATLKPAQGVVWSPLGPPPQEFRVGGEFRNPRSAPRERIVHEPLKIIFTTRLRFRPRPCPRRLHHPRV
jgi:hypothetical protein